MKDTADSKIVRISGQAILRRENLEEMDIREFPSRVMRRCPAIRLAVNRTHSVIGRIVTLVSSMITMKAIRAVGVPCGTRWVSMWFVFFVHPKRIIVNHIERDRGRVTVRWEVNEKF